MTAAAMILPPPLMLPESPTWRGWFAQWRNAMARAGLPLELRIDVDHPDEAVEDELRALHQRLYDACDCLHGIPAAATDHPGLVVRYREADGEYYCYVEDRVEGRLAGYTVFNRLVEVGRRADPHLRAPHSKFATAYQRRGLATRLYRWYLDGGRCLISGARQSGPAHALWHSLARSYTLCYVDLRGKVLTHLGPEVPPAVLDDLHTRMVMLGRGWTVERLAAATGMRL